MSRSALVFAGGPFDVSTLAFVDVAEYDEIWCADSGLMHAQASGITPTVIVGDCDSVSAFALDEAVASGMRVIKHPPEKNASDLELTFRELADAQYSSVTLLAASGGRTDHALFNYLLMMQQDWPFQLTLIDETISAYLVHGSIQFSAPLITGTVVSLLPRESVSGVTTQGLKYPLTDARLMGGSTLGLSNEADGTGDVCVSVEAGRLLVCVVHNDVLENEAGKHSD